VIRRISPIGLIGWISSHADRANGSSFRIFFKPQHFTALAQEVFIVEQQLVETRSCDVHQAQFRLTGGRRGSAAFGDVLPPAARGLDHLIVGARTLADKASHNDTVAS
jgi:hypothetical protein